MMGGFARRLREAAGALFDPVAPVAARIVAFARREPVLSIAALLALASFLLNPPTNGTASFAQYASFIDARVLSLLFCLMVCVAGLQKAGIFTALALRMLEGRRTVRFASVMLVAISFFASMFVTNDVALITFVPFAVMLLVAAGEGRRLALVVVLQTVAANLGSMMTPFGNPQNLFLYSHYGLGLAEFAGVMAPFAIASCVGLAAWAACAPAHPMEVSLPLDRAPVDGKLAFAFGVLFAISLAAVVRLVPVWACLVIVALCGLVLARDSVLGIDWGLLATFVCFFLFVGNVGAVPMVRGALEDLMSASPFAVSLLASQVISNVPAAVLLAPFTDSWQGLLLGVDIGGLGTPIVSLASLISLRLYAHAPQADMRRFMKLFFLVNVVFLAGNCALYALVA